MRKTGNIDKETAIAYRIKGDDDEQETNCTDDT